MNRRSRQVRRRAAGRLVRDRSVGHESSRHAEPELREREIRIQAHRLLEVFDGGVEIRLVKGRLPLDIQAIGRERIRRLAPASPGAARETPFPHSKELLADPAPQRLARERRDPPSSRPAPFPTRASGRSARPRSPRKPSAIPRDRHLSHDHLPQRGLPRDLGRVFAIQLSAKRCRDSWPRRGSADGSPRGSPATRRSRR